MKIIKAKCESNIFVDDEDYDYLMLYDFEINEHGYPIGKPKPKYKKMGLFSGKAIHSILIDKGVKGRSVVIDHKDGNKLNNQKDNLRICSHADNMRNRKHNSNSKEKYKGLTWLQRIKKWQVQIQVGENHIHIGTFSNEIAGANAYNYWAKHYFGEFALLNDVPFMEKEEWSKYASKGTSKYRGVFKNGDKWTAQIWENKNKKNIRIGDFDKEEDAAKAWNEKAIELRGNKAKLNRI